MRRTSFSVLMIGMFLLVVISCAGGSENAVTPSSCKDIAISAGAAAASPSWDNRKLWGLWSVTIDAATSRCDIVPLRTAVFTANVNNLLEAQPGNLLIEDMDVTDFFTEGRLDCTITLKHPLTGLDQYHGFDVWGVFMHNSNGSLNYDSLTYGADPDTNDNVAILRNPDGWTRWFNYTEFNGGGIPILEYWPGKLSNLPNPIATLNPYKIFTDGLGFEDDYYSWIMSPGNAEDRGIFRAGSVNSRRYELEFPIIGDNPTAEFQYAVIATWDPGDPALTGDPSIYDPRDFPTSANCEEPFFLHVSTVASELYYVDETELGGPFIADIEVFDWQGGSVGNLGVPNEVKSIIIEGDFVPGGTHEFTQAELATIAYPGTENSSIFQVEIVDCIPQASGEADFWVIVESDGMNGESYGQGFPTEYPDGARQAAFLPGTVTVGDEVPYVGGWAVTWGGSEDDWGCGVAVSSTGDIYVCGGFEGVADFDPGEGVVECTAVNTFGDFFISKFDSNGNFLWVRTWASDTGFDDIDVWGDYIYVCGYFSGDVDFDPGDGEDWHSAGESLDTFISKFDSSGNFIWARTWGGSNQNMAKSIAITPTGDVYSSGYFAGTTDFDPGSGEDWHTAHGTGVDVFLSKLDSSGNFIWARTWGSTDHGDDGWGLATDSQGDAYVTGDFDSTCDFDPDPIGEDWHTSNGDCDVFLSKFNSNGDFAWARTWGGTGIDMGASAIVYQLDDYVYISGQFENTVDFDPDSAVDNHISNGGRDAFISKFTSSGDFLWANTWGGSDYECVWYVNVSPDDEPCGCGYYRSSNVDFDPGPDVDEHSTNGGFDIFLTKFDSSGDFLWAKTWGGSGGDNSWGVAVSLESEVYITGNFEGTVDFDPSDGIDGHTSSGGDDAFLSKFLPNGEW